MPLTPLVAWQVRSSDMSDKPNSLPQGPNRFWMGIFAAVNGAIIAGISYVILSGA